MNSEILLHGKQVMVFKWWLAAFIIVAALGFFDATYLSVNHYQGTTPGCSLAHGCDAVLTSQYATVGSVPIALIGALYYLALLIFLLRYIDTGSSRWITLAAYCTALGFVVSSILLYLQAFVIQAWCQYCLVSAATTTVLFLLSLSYLFVNKRQSSKESG